MAFTCEAEILPGLRQFAKGEIQGRFKRKAAIGNTTRDDGLPFYYTGNLADLLQLKKVVAVYTILYFDVPRPRALLGHAHFQQILTQLKQIQALHPPNSFRTFRVSAAGQNSKVFTRLIDDIQQHSGLIHTPDEADMLMRIRPAQLARRGWEVLLRISPRPLAKRSWRIYDMPGALNATIAAAIVELTQPSPQDRFLNLMSGSGSLLIERLIRCPAIQAVGGEISADAIALARQNISAATLRQSVSLIQLDAQRTPLPSHCFNVICADLPWGQLVGSHSQNAELYPQLLTEIYRLATTDARIAILTHEIKHFERLLQDQAHRWRIIEAIQIYQGGLHPKIYLLST